MQIATILEKFRRDWDHIDSAAQVIDAIIDHLRAAEQTGYLGTLYRTDFEVEGVGEFPIDMLRYTSSWPKGESDTSAIADSFDGGGRRTIMLSKYHRDPEPNLAGDRWEAKFRWRVLRVVETVAI
jgi:hypothetical protein